MFSCSFSLSCVVGILCICLSGGSSHIKRCAETDRQALLKLKDGFFDEKGILSSWNGENCCNWKGISCNNLTGHVISLDLQHLNPLQRLGGKLDSSICELQHLTSIDLSHNHINGKIPKCIGSLNQLIELKLAFNELVGVIPPTLRNLSNLQVLYLGFNNLIANDIEWLSHLSKLGYLGLSFVKFSRAVDWLSSISKIPSLVELYLDGCGLCQFNLESNSSTSLKILHLSENSLNFSTLSWVLNVSKVLIDLSLSNNSLHSIPDSFANMISLQFLDLSYNSMHSIPDVFANMTSLQGIDLSYNSLHSIPDVLANMTSLQGIDLSNNELEDSIPKSFQSLCQLKGLWMRSNKLSGQLSDWIRQLYCAQNSLESLSLDDNCIVGSLPQSFGHFPHLQILGLGFNQLSGSLPLFDVSKMPSLEILNLAHNRLNGTLPNNIGQCSNLRILRVPSNQLNGAINEAHLSNLSCLEIFEVAENSLSFNLSSNWVPPFQLYALYASSCILGPKFPTWLKHQRRLDELDISNSGISDSFPKWLWNLSSSLSYLNVSHNKLSGALPKSLQGMKIEICDFSFNNLSGPLPPLSQSQILFLSNNMFSGSVSSFCATSPQSLTYLDLSNNLLVGSLSNCWVTFQQLQVLNLAKNSISGRIPNSFGTLRQMRSMHLNNSNFSGEIPSLILCSNLTVIDFGDNNLEGTLPAWVGHHLHHLIVLRLQGNKLKGSIPASLCNLLFLQVLDLSKNNITGEIPQCLNHIIALSNMTFPKEPISYGPPTSFSGNEEIGLFIDQAILAWKGENREYGKILGLMITVDLSSNHLIGEIPQCITKLVALAGLNLSGNNLTGIIPNNIGQMEMLESLDLSRNRLHGRMPESFSNLSFLSYMNLSFNNLSGKIPLGTQLQSFSASSYEGNSGLCGPPLTSHCPEDAISPTGSLDKHVTSENDDELISFGFYISLGLGFCVGFWGVCGTLVIKTSWRHAYFQFFNNMNDWIHVKLVIFMVRMKRRFQYQD